MGQGRGGRKLSMDYFCINEYRTEVGLQMWIICSVKNYVWRKLFREKQYKIFLKNMKQTTVL